MQGLQNQNRNRNRQIYRGIRIGRIDRIGLKTRILLENFIFHKKGKKM
jgi:hypothetical protein